MTMPASSWRSILFVPALAPQLIEGAQSRGADAVQLDLEDAIPADRKARAREAIPAALAHLSGGPADLLVRINRPWRDAVPDLECCVWPGLAAVTLPKTDGPSDLSVVAEVLDALEAERGITAGSVGIVAQIEDAAGLLAMERAERFTPRLVGITLGPEDFALDLRVGADGGELGRTAAPNRCAGAFWSPVRPAPCPWALRSPSATTRIWTRSRVPSGRRRPWD